MAAVQNHHDFANLAHNAAKSRHNGLQVKALVLLIVCIFCYDPVEGIGSGDLLQRKHHRVQRIKAHKRVDAEGPFMDMVGRGVERVAHAVGLKDYKFGDLTKKFKEFASSATAYFKGLDRRKKLSSYWDFLGKEHDAGTYKFRLPDFYKNISIEDFAKIANGAIKSKPPRSAARPRFAVQPANGSSEPSTSVSASTTSGSDQAVVITATDVTPLPDEYDFFRDYPACVREGLDQGRCGSCWAFSTTTMLTHRVCREVERLRRNDASYMQIPSDWRLGAQSLCSCCSSATTVPICGSGACAGGNTFAALMWADKNPIWSADCAKYESWSGSSEDQMCPKFKDICKKDKVGFFGFLHKKRTAVHKLSVSIDTPSFVFNDDNVNTTNIMREVYENGPVVAVIETATAFMGYTGDGVFAAGSAPDRLGVGVHQSHAFVIVGWGTQMVKGQPVKYWLIENSWGASKYMDMPRGYRHMVRIVRGVDDMNIESNGVMVAIPRLLRDGVESSIKDAWPRS